MRYIRVSKFYICLGAITVGWVVGAIVRTGGALTPHDFGGLTTLIMVGLIVPFYFEKE